LQERIEKNQEVLGLCLSRGGEVLDEDSRRKIINLYSGLGGFTSSRGEGLAGLHQARIEGFCQFFTPPMVGELIRGLLGIPQGATIFEPSIGSGSLLFDIQDQVNITGIELEEKAFLVCRTCLPKASLLQDDFINYKPRALFDYVVGNPPFSMTLTDRRGLYYNKNWEGHILSHLACLELSVEAVKPGGFVALIMPSDFLGNSETVTFHRWLNEKADLIAKIKLPKDTFSATEWETSLFIFQKSREYWDGLKECFEYDLKDFGEVEALLSDFHRSASFARTNGYAEWIRPKDKPIEIEKYVEPEKEKKMSSPSLSLSNIDQVMLFAYPKKTILKPLSLGAQLKLKKLELQAKRIYDRKTGEATNAWLELLNAPYVQSKDKIIEGLTREGIEIIFNQSEIDRQDNFSNWLKRQGSSYARVIKKGQDWERINFETSVDEAYGGLLGQRMALAQESGLNKWLFPFQFSDTCRMSLKDSNLLAYDMGLGKTRVAIALQMLYGSKKGLYVCSSKLIGEWEMELNKIGMAGEYRIIESLLDCRRLKRFNLISYEKLWRIPQDSEHYGYQRIGEDLKNREPLKYSFSDILKKEFPFVCIDEAYNIKNPQSRRAKAVFNLRAKHKLALTGTPIKGYPQNILAILNWLFGCGSALLPEYSYWKEGGPKKFIDTFGTYIYYDRQHETTADKGKKKQIPKIKNVKKFYELLRAKMIRRLMDEPEVREVIKTKEPEVRYIDLELTPEHRKFYQLWLDNFTAWYEERREEERLGGKRLGQMELLAKLGYLIQVACVPQSSHLKDESCLIPSFGDGLSSVQKWIILKTDEEVKKGNKVIIFTRFLDSVEFLKQKLSYLNPAVVTGDVSLHRKKRTGKSKRQGIIENFRWNGQNVLIAGMGCLCEGLNISEANVGIFADYDWTPSIMFQALHRMVRPDQKKQVVGYFLTLRGTIYDYMKMITQLKQKSIDEGVDHQEYDLKTSDIPDIRQYVKAIVEEGSFVPPKRTVYLKKEEVKEDDSV
jgi:SNF2 family DNA or RNA helicase